MNITELVGSVRAAQRRVNLLTLNSRGGEVDDLIQKSRGILVSELTKIGTTPDSAYEVLLTHLMESEDPSIEESEVVSFLEYCID